MPTAGPTAQVLSHTPLFRAYLFSLKAPTHRRILDMLNALALGYEPPEVSDEDEAAGRRGKAATMASLPPPVPVPRGGRHGGGAAAAPAAPALLGGMPPAPPVMRRLNSGLADLLEFGPTLSSARDGHGGSESEAASARDEAASAPAAAASSGGGSGRRSTRTSHEGGALNPMTRLRNRVVTTGLHEVASRLFGFEPMVVYTPDAFLKTMWVSLPQFAGFKQQDAEEFLRALLNRLDEEARAAGDLVDPAPSPSASSSGSGSSSSSGSDGAWRCTSSSPPTRAHRRGTWALTHAALTALGRMFKGVVVTTVTCSVCSRVSRREEPFFGPLAVEIPIPYRTTSPKGTGPGIPEGGVPVRECLDEAFVTETLTGETAYECERCKRKVTATLARRIAQLPPVLVLHIVRTAWSLGGAKTQTHVAVPTDGLDLSPWMEGSRGAGDASTVTALTAVYDLHGVVQHAGRGIREGHYVAYARNDTSDEWHLFNDGRVSGMGADGSREIREEIQGYLYVLQRRHMLLP